MKNLIAKALSPVTNAVHRVADAIDTPHVMTVDITETYVIPGTEETFVVRRIQY